MAMSAALALAPTATGTIDYPVKPSVDLHLGYRCMNFNYTASGGFDLGYNVHMRGPILGATFQF
jgi:hypothetical protein